MAALRFGLIRRYLWPYRRQVGYGVAALVVVNLLSVSIPLLVRGVINDLPGGLAQSDLLGKAALIVVLATAMASMRLLSRTLVFGVGRQVEANLKQQIFDHMLRQEPGWIQSIGSGEVISRDPAAGDQQEVLAAARNRRRSLRENPKAAAAPATGSGPGTAVGGSWAMLRPPSVAA